MDPVVYTLALLIAGPLSIIGVTLSAIKQVDEGNEVIVQRFGRFHRKLKPGLNFGVIPFVDEIVVEATVKERMFNTKPTRVVTKNGVHLNIDTAVFWQLIDLYSAFYRVDNVEEAINYGVAATLRSKIREMDIQEVYSSQDEISRTLLVDLDELTEVWGVKLTRAEIQDIQLIESATNTISLPFSEGIDWQALEASFAKVIIENEGVELSVESIERREDNALIIKVKIPPTADKEKILIELIRNYESSVKAIEQRYQSELQGREDQISIYRQHYSSLEEIIHKLADRSTRLESATIEVKAIAGNHSMNSNDYSQNVNAGRDINLAGSTLNVGEISGNISNTINELRNTALPEAVELADLLKKLQIAIESEIQLTEDDKAIALEQTVKLAEAGKDPTEGTTKKAAKLAIGFLKGLVGALPDTAKLAESCAKLLPMITTLLGL